MNIVGAPAPTWAAGPGAMPAASWPHTITTNEATIVVYQPQVITWKEYRTLEVRMAVAVTRQGTMKPVLGAVDASVDTQTEWNNGSWNAVQPRTQAASGAGSAQSPLAVREESALSSRREAASTTDFGQLNQDHQARLQGIQRQQDFSAWRESGQSARDFGNRSFGGGEFAGGRFGDGGFHGGGRR
jgi:hypothetical protein